MHALLMWQLLVPIVFFAMLLGSLCLPLVLATCWSCPCFGWRGWLYFHNFGVFSGIIALFRGGLPCVAGLCWYDPIYRLAQPHPFPSPRRGTIFFSRVRPPTLSLRGTHPRAPRRD